MKASDTKDSPPEGPRRGTLYVCATPIGNLEDITLRVLRILREVALIAAEDTRHTKALLRHFDIDTPLTSLHEHNEERKSVQLCKRLLAGESIALVTDAGMPGISDPGARFVAEAVRRDIPVVVAPGPSALTAALVLSGLDVGRFAFEGFLPRSPQLRRRVLRRLADEERTLVFFEAPHRIQETLADMLALWGDRPCALARELTKVHEEVLRGTLATIAEELERAPRRGEMVLVVGGRDVNPEPSDIGGQPVRRRQGGP